jgi:hypothetical protein
MTEKEWKGLVSVCDDPVILDIIKRLEELEKKIK